jgi:hypothetical protein
VLFIDAAAATRVLNVIRRISLSQNGSTASAQGEMAFQRTVVGAAATPTNVQTPEKTEQGDPASVFRAVGTWATAPTLSGNPHVSQGFNVLTGYERAWALNDPDAPKMQGVGVGEGFVLRVVLPAAAHVWVVEIDFTEIG